MSDYHLKKGGKCFSALLSWEKKQWGAYLHCCSYSDLQLFSWCHYCTFSTLIYGSVSQRKMSSGRDLMNLLLISNLKPEAVFSICCPGDLVKRKESHLHTPVRISALHTSLRPWLCFTVRHHLFRTPVNRIEISGLNAALRILRGENLFWTLSFSVHMRTKHNVTPTDSIQ